MGRISEIDHDNSSPDGDDAAEPMQEVNLERNVRDEVYEAADPETTVGNSRYLMSIRGTIVIDLPVWLMRYRFDPATQASHGTNR